MVDRFAFEAPFRLIVDSTVDCAVFMVNRDGIVVTWDQHAEHISGYPADEMTGQHFSALYPKPEVECGIPGQSLDIATFQGKFVAEGRRLRKGGSPFWADIVITPIRDAGGKLHGFVHVMRDLTEKRQIRGSLAETDDLEHVSVSTPNTFNPNLAIQKNEERFRQIVEAAPNAMVLTDQANRIDTVNSEAERLFGYSRDELLGQPLDMLAPAQFRSGHSDGLNSVFADRSTEADGNSDLHCRRRDGSEFPVKLGSSSIETDEGVMTLFVITDISGQKYREEHIREALREKDILLGEIHHRVKNNLQVISSLLELQSARLSDETMIGMLRDSQNRVRSMALVYQILHETNDLTKVDFGSVIKSLVPSLISSYQVDTSNISVSIDTENILLPINAAIPCGLIVNELVSNALEHAFPLGRPGTVAIVLKYDSAEKILLSISDDGIGLSSGFTPQAAETFGLQIVELLTGQLGGEMMVNPSIPTTFALRVPRHGYAPT